MVRVQNLKGGLKEVPKRKGKGKGRKGNNYYYLEVGLAVGSAVRWAINEVRPECWRLSQRIPNAEFESVKSFRGENNQKDSLTGMKWGSCEMGK